MTTESSAQKPGRIAVIDVETTGLGNNARVLEIGCVTLNSDGEIVDEWDTLLNPGSVSVGATWVHGITRAMVHDAPTFRDILPLLADQLDGAVIAAHNLPFDSRMLAGEFQRTKTQHQFGRGIDTLKLTRCKLAIACRNYAIELDHAHSALCDARATAKLLVAVAEQNNHDVIRTIHAPMSVVYQQPLLLGRESVSVKRRVFG